MRRGLCGACYQQAYRRDKSGKESFEKMIKRGLILPNQQGGNGLFNQHADETQAAGKK